ncbi:hypothetical protein FQZ97_1168860 [compost metagenome]
MNPDLEAAVISFRCWSGSEVFPMQPLFLPAGGARATKDIVHVSGGAAYVEVGVFPFLLQDRDEIQLPIGSAVVEMEMDLLRK